MAAPNPDGRRPWPAPTSYAARATVGVLAVVAAAMLAFALVNLILLAFVALVLAAALDAPVSWLARHRVPRVLAVVLTYLAVIGSVALVLIVIIPPLARQTRDLVSAIPDAVRDVIDAIQPVVDQIAGVSGQNLLDFALSQLQSLAPALDVVAQLPIAIAQVLVDLGSAIFLSALMIIERDRAKRWLKQFLAPQHRETLDDVGGKSMHKLGAFVRGQLIVMTVTGIGYGVGLYLLGVPFALPLGALGFITEIIPIAGPILSGIPMIIVATLQSPLLGLATLGLVIAIQQLEGWLLVPLIQGKVISISPMVALLAVLAGAALAGILGALLAIPAVAVVHVVINDIVVPWRRRSLGLEVSDDRGVAPESEGDDGDGDRPREPGAVRTGRA